jgi:hypothetical protein
VQKRESAKFSQLTDLQWECFFTCWRYNLNFFHRSKKAHLVHDKGISLYYYFLGRRPFGKAMKYPLLRMGHFLEWMLEHKLYLDFTGKRSPRLGCPKSSQSLTALRVRLSRYYDLHRGSPEVEFANYPIIL